MTSKFLLFISAIVIAAITSAACETAPNTNANVRNANANTAVVVNSNTNVANTTSNANRWNANITREEYERDRDSWSREVGSSKIGQGANDMWLWVKTRSVLMTADDLRESTINVDVENDVVTLRGTVGSAAQKSQAEKLAKGVEGVKSVRNQLTVSADDSAMDMDDDNSNSNRR